LLSAI